MRKEGLRSLFIYPFRDVYTRLRQAIKPRPSFTEDEVRYLIDIVDSWTETYKHIEAEDDEVQHLHEDMSTAIDVRNKLWRQLNG